MLAGGAVDRLYGIARLILLRDTELAEDATQCSPAAPSIGCTAFLGISSQALGGKSGAAWVADLMRDPDTGCGTSATQPITIDGVSGRFCPSTGVVLVTKGDRGYSITRYVSGDQPWFARYYDDAWYRSVIDTVRLHPEDARLPAAPSTPASASAKPS